MLFAGPATAGSIAPNIAVRPEKGNNFDAGATFRLARLSGGAHFFFNRYEDFIAQDLVVATTPGGPLAQATNFADVRIGGIELSAGAPLTVRRGVVTLTGGVAFTRGTIAEGDQPADRRVARRHAGRQHHARARRCSTRDSRTAAAGGGPNTASARRREVSRVAETMLDSPFLIAQDLLSLDGLTVQRVGWGLDLTRGRERASVVVRHRKPDGSLLPRAVPVRAGARTERHRGLHRRRVLTLDGKTRKGDCPSSLRFPDARPGCEGLGT